MRVDLFDFHLPPERIAQSPATPRDSAKLLAIGETLADSHMRDLPALMRPGDVLVFNDTKVIPARLKGRRGTAKVEITLHKPLGGVRWLAFAKPARKLERGHVFYAAEALQADIVDKYDTGEVLVEFRCREEELFALLERHGEPPLPPYIRRKDGATAEDSARYQTIFAQHAGAVAAPTAGLHFTPELLQALRGRGAELAFVTLHVGAGTFLPVKVEDTRDHKMHAEYGVITEETARQITQARREGRRIIAVGTTALRVLESAADTHGDIHPFAKETDIFITPGYRFKAVDALLTNFHLPRSTLFMLVCAFAGTERMKAAYAHAIAKEYRFYSYGDACLLYGEHT